jgi:NTE family protein
MFMHCVDAEAEMRKLGTSSKLNAQWDFLMYLHQLGRARAATFLEANYDKLGRESSTDLTARFL